MEHKKPPEGPLEPGIYFDTSRYFA